MSPGGGVGSLCAPCGASGTRYVSMRGLVRCVTHTHVCPVRVPRPVGLGGEHMCSTRVHCVQH
eukprot:1392622-Prymnesium_polylepis.1